LKLPTLENTPSRRDPPVMPMTTGNVGKTCCGSPAVFSVVNASSSVPAPMPTA
jgi:hypothetical protein